MIRSMTGFARQVGESGAGSLVWEMRSLNHRYLEVTVRLPEPLRALEPEVRRRVAGAVRRGRVECQLKLQGMPAQAVADVDWDQVAGLAEACRQVVERFDETAPVDPLAVLQWPGVLQSPEPDAAELSRAALSLLDEALATLDEERRREGEALSAVISERTAQARTWAQRAAERVPNVRQQLRERLETRLADLRETVDPARLEQELVLQVQRLDVDEELARLGEHLDEVDRVLVRDEPVGRRLDFLMQELHREANTLGAKSSDGGLTEASVELKVLIEQMREQVQNVE